jgi:hypothetical protein
MGSIKVSANRSTVERGDCINPPLRSWVESTLSGSSAAIAFRALHVDFLYRIELLEKLDRVTAMAH